MKQTKQFSCALLMLMLFVVQSVVAYQIDVSTSPENVIARDNPFAHYNGALPSIHVAVRDDTGKSAENIMITITITHIDNLILPSGFPHYQGAELLSVSELSTDGTLDVDALLFPLRGQYAVDVTVEDTQPAQSVAQTQRFIINAAEPFKQSTLNAIIFIAILCLFGLIVGWIFGKDFKMAAKGQYRPATSFFGVVVIAVIVGVIASVVAVAAHNEAMNTIEEKENYYADSQLIFYTSPRIPDIGEKTTFTFIIMDENGIPVDNAVAYITLANEEEGFDVLGLKLFSQNGMFSFNYGIFDGAPHTATIHVKPTSTSSRQFATIDAVIPFAGIARNPPLSAKIVSMFVMLAAILLGFVSGIILRKLRKKNCTGEKYE